MADTATTVQQILKISIAQGKQIDDIIERLARLELNGQTQNETLARIEDEVTADEEPQVASATIETGTPEEQP